MQVWYHIEKLHRPIFHCWLMSISQNCRSPAIFYIGIRSLHTRILAQTYRRDESKQRTMAIQLPPPPPPTSTIHPPPTASPHTGLSCGSTPSLSKQRGVEIPSLSRQMHRRYVHEVPSIAPSTHHPHSTIVA